MSAVMALSLFKNEVYKRLQPIFDIELSKIKLSKTREDLFFVFLQQQESKNIEVLKNAIINEHVVDIKPTGLLISPTQENIIKKAKTILEGIQTSVVDVDLLLPFSTKHLLRLFKIHPKENNFSPTDLMMIFDCLKAVEKGESGIALWNQYVRKDIAIYLRNKEKLPFPCYCFILQYYLTAQTIVQHKGGK